MAFVLGLVGRAIVYRRGLSVAVFLVGLVTAMSAAIGPFYFRSAAESILRDHLTEPAAQDVGLGVSTQTTARDHPLRQIQRAIRRAHPPPAYDRQVGMLTLGYGGKVVFQRSDHHTGQAYSAVAYRQDQCAHVHLVAGRCPVRPGEAMVTERVAATSGRYGYDWSVGATLDSFGIEPLDVYYPPVPIPPLVLHVVGVFRPADSLGPYWFGHDLFESHYNNDDRPDTVDTMLVAQSTIERETVASVAASADLYVNPHRVRLDSERRFASDVSAFRTRILRSSQGFFGYGVQTKVGAQLHAADRDRRLLAVSVVVVTVQVGLLAALVLYIVVANAAEVRGPEIALAKLRGYSPGRTVAFGVLEPILLITLALPLALVLADLAVRAVSASVFAPGTPVALRAPPVLAVLGGYVGALLAACLAGARVLRRPVVEQWRRTARPATGARPLAVAEILLFGLAIAGLVELRLHGTLKQGNAHPIALLAPLLLIVVVTTVTVRLVRPLLALLIRRTRASRRVGAFLAIRQVARRPGAFSLAGLLAIAIALAVFAIEATAVSRHNENQRARLDVGASTVLALGTNNGDQIIAAVNHVDPAGRWAMAAAQWLPFGGTVTGRIVAVQTDRFASVGYWREDFADRPLPHLLRALSPPVPPAIVVRGDAVQITATAAPRSAAPVNLGIDFTDPKSTPVTFGHLRRGTHTYVGRVTGCRGGCVVRDLSLQPDLGDFRPLRGSVTFTAMRGHDATGWRTLPATFGTAYAWGKPGGAGYGGTVRTSDGAVTYDYDTVGGQPPPLLRAVAPTPFPMALGPRTVAGTTSTISDGNVAPIRVVSVGRPFELPSAGSGSDLVDLRLIRAALPSFDDYAQYSVWLSDAAPSDATQRLEAAGLDIAGIQRTSTRFHQLTRTGPALGVLLFTLCALAGALLAGAATAVSLHVTGRRRLHELAALSVAGAQRRTLFGATVGEIGLSLGVAVVAGAVAGLVSSAIVLPAVPEFPTNAPPPLQYALPWLPALALLAVVVVLVAVAAVVGASALVRSARPSLLREPAP